MPAESSMRAEFLDVMLGRSCNTFRRTVKLTVVEVEHSEAQGVGVITFNPMGRYKQEEMSDSYLYVPLDMFLGSKELLGGILPIPSKGDGLWISSLEISQQVFGIRWKGRCWGRPGFLQC
jgi:hypothetical protein